ncbi:MAG: hypothetical protein R3Y46_00585 [Opitutales bacterium]
MKKLIILLASILTLAASLNAQSPEFLKDRANFSDFKKFESPAIYTNLQANADLIANYEANPASFKDEELFPVIMAYMSSRKVNEGEALLLKHTKAVPANIAAIRNLASIAMIKGDAAQSIALYKTAAATGDELALKSLASAYVISKQIGEIKTILAPLSELAKTDLEAANILLIYAISEDVKDETLAKNVIASLNLDEILKTTKIDALNTAYNLYKNRPEIWSGDAILVPARVAILSFDWTTAGEAVDKVLKSNPKNTLALKTKAIVEYKTGDVNAGFKYIAQAVALGDKSAFNDFIELAVVKGQSDKIKNNMTALMNAELNVKSNIMLVRYGLARNDADAFFLGLLGKNSDVLFTNEQNKLIIAEGLKKFSTDSRAKAVEAKLK